MISWLFWYVTQRFVNYLPTFLDNLSVPSSMGMQTPEDETDSLSRSVGIQLPISSASHFIRAKIKLNFKHRCSPSVPKKKMPKRVGVEFRV